MTIPVDPTNGSMGMTVKERLDRIENGVNSGFLRIENKLDDAASKVEVIALAVRVSALELKEAVSATEQRQIDTFRKDMREEVGHLTETVSAIGKKIAYAAGVIATLIVLANLIARFIPR